MSAEQTPTEDTAGEGQSDAVQQSPRPLRTWPAVLLVILIPIARFGPMAFEGGLSRFWMIAVFGPLLCCLLLLIWWLAASRATWRERVFGLLGLAGSLGITLLLEDPTMRGPGTSYLTLPMGMIAFALAATVLRRGKPVMRTGFGLLLAFVGFGFSLLLRSDGMTGDYVFSTHWRWSETPESRLLAERKEASSIKSDGPGSTTFSKALANPEWPGFRGADRASRARTPLLSTNWTAHPPRPVWKIQVGPGWSSFAVAGERLFTQEQRGPMETVTCYDAGTGREIWNRPVEARFDEPLGGPGPRATPTIGAGGLFTTGASGVFLRLNPTNGEIIWQVDLKKAAGREAPMWGFSASPLVVGSIVAVYTGGPKDKGVLGFDVATGSLRWSASAGNDSYASPQLTRIAGEELMLMLTNDGLVFLDPATGAERLNYDWKFMNYRALQPQLVGEDTILLPTGMNTGTRAIRIAKVDGKLKAEELWTSRNLKPDFSDFVTHEGHAYGVDLGIFTCVNLKTGERQWKGGRYGKGQVLLIENQGLLLVAAESGEVALLQADPKEQIELGRFKAIEGKTWNHPVVVGDRLYVRNSQEAACYQLPLASTVPAQ